jgi:hypothetical protein
VARESGIEKMCINKFVKRNILCHTSRSGLAFLYPVARHGTLIVREDINIYLHDSQLEQILTLADLSKEPVTKCDQSEDFFLKDCKSFAAIFVRQRKDKKVFSRILTMMKWSSHVQILYQILSVVVQSTYNLKSIP